MSPFSGSSPLARGLPLSMSPCSAPVGIIPARAGFTRGLFCGATHVKDHPRSRGVYITDTSPQARTAGSSPLARGLPRMTVVLSQRSGIIPARAGFTDGQTSPEKDDADHPRSRGVYRFAGNRKNDLLGSSPLARGLQERARARRLGPGIIPARAGFTAQAITSAYKHSDHPRSRGVYVHASITAPVSGGSSPLARGLPFVHVSSHRRRGIIPARAGFTLATGGPPPGRADHPRSRGVYPHSERGPTQRAGSSPLARGLPVDPHHRRPTGRIIPARAGFTHYYPHSTKPQWDHPRSRGVYPADGQGKAAGSGSSPLARGLPARRRPATDSRGIIPARAGFTAGAEFVCSYKPDHPRSRGVYTWRSA